MINLQMYLTGAHKDKISMTQAENTLNLLEVQGWLVVGMLIDTATSGVTK